jgi:hypothetical protein
MRNKLYLAGVLIALAIYTQSGVSAVESGIAVAINQQVLVNAMKACTYYLKDMLKLLEGQQYVIQGYVVENLRIEKVEVAEEDIEIVVKEKSVLVAVRNVGVKAAASVSHVNNWNYKERFELDVEIEPKGILLHTEWAFTDFEVDE